MVLLFLYLALAVGVSFLCSILEAVLLSVTPSYIVMLETKGKKSGQRLKNLKKDIDRPLSAILSLNTIAHTVGAAGVGAQAQVVFGNSYVAVTSAILTLVILVISEIIPKTIGALFWRSLAPLVTTLLEVMIVTMFPLVWLSRGITYLLSGGKVKQSMSREEIAALAERGAQEGIIDEGESRIFKNLIKFETLRTKDIMTPRTVAKILPQSSMVKEFKENTEKLRFSRIPVYADDPDDITGYVFTKEVLLSIVQGRDELRLADLKRNLVVVNKELPINFLFERLLTKQEHIALVVDSYGGMSGIVTIEDIVETMLGIEIVDEADLIDDMQILARQKWEERARKLGIVDENNSSDEPSSSQKSP